MAYTTFSRAAVIAPQNGPSYGRNGASGDIRSCPARHSCSNKSRKDNVSNFVSTSELALRTGAILILHSWSQADYADCSSESNPRQCETVVQNLCETTVQTGQLSLVLDGNKSIASTHSGGAHCRYSYVVVLTTRTMPLHGFKVSTVLLDQTRSVNPV